MSFRASLWAKKVKAPSALSKLLLIMMADAADESGLLFGRTANGGIWNYSIEHYADEAQMSRRAAYNHLAKLIEAGFVEQISKGDQFGNRSKYRLLIPAEFGEIDQQNRSRVPPKQEEEACAPDAQGVVHEVHKGSARDAQDPVHEVHSACARGALFPTDNPTGNPTDKNINPEPVGSGQKSYPPEFESLWKLFDRKTGKKKAYTEFKKLKPDKQTIELMRDALLAEPGWRKRKRAAGDWVAEQQDPERWFKNERWTDERDEPAIHVANGAAGESTAERAARLVAEMQTGSAPNDPTVIEGELA